MIPRSLRFHPTRDYLVFLVRLRRAREERELSLPELAESLELTVADVEDLESGSRPMDFLQLRGWCAALGLSWMTFLSELDAELDRALPPGQAVLAPENAAAPQERSNMSRPSPEPEVPTIQVLFFPGSDELPEVRRIPNSLEAKQELVGGIITTFETGVDGTVGVAGDEAVLQGLPFNRPIPPTGAGIFGPFLVAGDAQAEFRSVSPLELERVLDALAPELSQEQCAELMRAHDGGTAWMESWE